MSLLQVSINSEEVQKEALEAWHADQSEGEALVVYDTPKVLPRARNGPLFGAQGLTTDPVIAYYGMTAGPMRRAENAAGAVDRSATVQRHRMSAAERRVARASIWWVPPADGATPRRFGRRYKIRSHV